MSIREQKNNTLPVLLQLCYKHAKPLYKQKPIVYYVYEHQSKALDRGLDTGPASHGVYAVEGQITVVFKKTGRLEY